jgi:hypothetical protein
MRLKEVIETRGPALREAFRKLELRGEKVCGYGAPAKLTTFMYALKLTDVKLDCIGEDNPRKVGRTTPGMHVPIVSVDDMLSRNPDTIVVFAWNFFEDIRDRLRARGYKGGIINPMGGANAI